MNTMYVMGRNAVDEVLSSGRKTFRVLALKSSDDGRLKAILDKARAKGVAVELKSREELSRLVNGSHQGIVAECEGYAFSSIDVMLENAHRRGEAPFLLMLESIQDPHNLGAILRTAETAGVHGVIIGKNRSVGLTYAVAKTAAGALEYVPVAQVTNLVRTIDDLKKQGLWAACADMDGGLIYHTDLTCPLLLVIGGEHEGVGRLVRQHCDMTVRLPMAGHITSLNASVAAGISMYEVVRQRGALHADQQTNG